MLPYDHILYLHIKQTHPMIEAGKIYPGPTFYCFNCSVPYCSYSYLTFLSSSLECSESSCRNGDSEPNDPSQGDSPLVHLRLTSHDLTCLCRIGLVFPEVEVEEDGSEDERESVDSSHPIGQELP